MYKYFLVRFDLDSIPSELLSSMQVFCNSDEGEKNCFSVASDSWINAINEFIDEISIDKYYSTDNSFSENKNYYENSDEY